MSWKYAAILAFYVALPQSSFAVMLGLSTQELTRSASLVVIGEVESVTSAWTQDKKTIITTAEVIVAEALKGSPKTKKIRVQYHGGQVGDTIMRQSDAPVLNQGEKVLLFLAPGEPVRDGEAHTIAGRAQGKYTIGGDLIARKQGFTAIAGNPESMDLSISLEALIRNIRSHADEK